MYEQILLDLKEERNKDKQAEANSLNNDLLKVESRLENLQNKYMDGEIDKKQFDAMQERYNKEVANLQNQVKLYKNPNCSNIKPKLKYSILLINSIDKYMRDAKVEVKCKLISSIFPEKITFDGNHIKPILTIQHLT